MNLDPGRGDGGDVDGRDRGDGGGGAQWANLGGEAM